MSARNSGRDRQSISESEPPVPWGAGLYSACDGPTWLRMVLNSGSSAARASINAGELSWQGAELLVEIP
jgi:hypothetical protein